MRNHLLWAISILLINITSCTNTKNKPILSKPPQMIDKLDDVDIGLIQSKKLSKQVSEPSSSSRTSNPVSLVQEERSNGGKVEKIKVHNKGKLPDYYIYPKDEQNINNQPNKSLNPPTWQINW